MKIENTKAEKIEDIQTSENKLMDRIKEIGYINGVRMMAAQMTSECFIPEEPDGSERIYFRFKDGVLGEINSGFKKEN